MSVTILQNESPMNTTILTSKLGNIVSALLFSAVFAYSAKASTPLAETNNAASTNVTCSGSKTVPVTSMKPQLPNGKGAMVATQVGTKRICQICPVSTKVVTNAWPNHKGPTLTVETMNAGSIHDCSAGCGLVAKN